jgi:hypothetical protein
MVSAGSNNYTSYFLNLAKEGMKYVTITERRRLVAEYTGEYTSRQLNREIWEFFYNLNFHSTFTWTFTFNVASFYKMTVVFEFTALDLDILFPSVAFVHPQALFRNLKAQIRDITD